MVSSGSEDVWPACRAHLTITTHFRVDNLSSISGGSWRSDLSLRREVSYGDEG